MAYTDFLASLAAGDTVILYFHDYGIVHDAVILAVRPDGSSAVDALGGVEFSAKGNGRGPARSAKLMPAQLEGRLKSSAEVFTAHQLEAMV